MLVVADTSPINYLVLIGSIEVLPKLYGQVIIPSAVHDELLASASPAIVRNWANALPRWIEVQTPAPARLEDPRLRSLDRGERAALALMIDRQDAVLLIDERVGTAVARRLGMVITRTLGLLDEAAREGLLSLPDAIGRLRQTSFRYRKT